MNILKLITFLLYVNFSIATDFEKSWIPNTNFENANNWDNNKLPCSEDRILFPINSPEISIAKNHIFTDIILPYNGELKLQSGISLSFSHQSANPSECIGRDAHFIRTKTKNWLNPENWCQKRNNQCFKNVIEADVMPNQYDTVIFPPLSSYYVEIDQKTSIEVSSVNLKGKVFRRSRNLRQFLSSNGGKSEFTLKGSRRSPTISLSGKQCRDPSGCVPNTLKMMKSICPHVNCSTQQSCKKTVKPTGACCAICGSIMVIVIDHNFQISSVERVINETVPQSQWSLMKISSYQVQLVLWSESDSKLTGPATIKLYSLLKSKSQELSIKDIRLSTSHSIHSIRHGLVALTVILVLMLLGVLSGAMFYGYQKYKTGELNLGRVEILLRRMRPRLSVFNRTTNRHSHLQESSYSASTEKKFNDDIELPSAVAFDNPIFEGVPKEEEKASKEPMELLDLDDDASKTTVEIENVCSTEIEA